MNNAQRCGMCGTRLGEYCRYLKTYVCDVCCDECSECDNAVAEVANFMRRNL